MRFRRLPFKRPADRTLIVPADKDRQGINSASLSIPDATVESVVAAVNGAIQILEGSRNSLHEPIMHLAASAEALAAMAKAISERAGTVVQPAFLTAGGDLKAAIDQLTMKIEQLAERPADTQPAQAVAGELKTVIGQLTAKIERLAERAADTQPAQAAGELKTAIDRLTTNIEQLAERPADTQPAQAAGELKTVIGQLTA